MPQQYAYISHNRASYEFVQQLQEWLAAAGIRTATRELQVGGSAWAQNLFEEIDECYALVYVHTPTSLSSHWVMGELGHGWRINKPIVVVLPEGDLENLPDAIRATRPVNDTDDEIAMFIQARAFDLSTPDKLKEFARLVHILNGLQDLADSKLTLLPDQIITMPAFGGASPEDQFKTDVFMVMPFRDDLYPIYEGHIKKVAEELELKIRRGDDPFSHHDIMREIWSLIYNCQVVIADCTGRNANVFYELGIAHTLGKPAVMITQTMDDLPFDVRSKRAIVYDPQRMQKFEKDLKGALQKILK